MCGRIIGIVLVVITALMTIGNNSTDSSRALTTRIEALASSSRRLFNPMNLLNGLGLRVYRDSWEDLENRNQHNMLDPFP